jgi:hypothetical protein
MDSWCGKFADQGKGSAADLMQKNTPLHPQVVTFGMVLNNLNLFLDTHPGRV